MIELAKRDSWENYPIDKPSRIDIDLYFTADQYAKLKDGLIPHQMEEKWFIFFENDWLYFHRSWTGIGIFKAEILKQDDGYVIKEFWVERNFEKYSNDDHEVDRDTLSFLIAQGILGIEVRELFIEKHVHTEGDVIGSWSSFGNMMFTPPKEDLTDKIKSVLFGLSIGDALGVPVEFKSREELRKNPVKDMIGYGTYNLPPGTFSDDSSMAFCLAEALTEGYDLDKIAQNFVAWRDKGYWTANGKVFDIGNTTNRAISRLVEGVSPSKSGESGSDSNGNGSIMRILPLLFNILDKHGDEQFEIIKQVSSITHAHIRSVIACYYYMIFAWMLNLGKDKFTTYSHMQILFPIRFKGISVSSKENAIFDRLLKGNIYELPEKDISSSGYVVHTLEASIWCLMTTDNYKDAVLKAVNLGEDTDTTAAVTGGLAGLLYGLEGIPDEWIRKLARHDDIEDLAVRLGKVVL